MSYAEKWLLVAALWGWCGAVVMYVKARIFERMYHELLEFTKKHTSWGRLWL